MNAVLISGIDLLRGLENGPCNVTQNLTTVVNENSWNEVSNMLYISQPLGVGFSYAEEVTGTFNPFTGEVENATFGGVTGEWAYDPSPVGTTETAAMATWHVLQGFLSALPQLNGNVSNKTFNLWTESYGGHYGPSFYNYFYEQNALIANGSISGTPLIFDTLGIGNGLISESIQAPHYPEFAVNNTYAIKTVNDTIYEYMKFALYMPSSGCLDLCDQCEQANRSTYVGQQFCFQAASQCMNNVVNPYSIYSGRSFYESVTLPHDLDSY